MTASLPIISSPSTTILSIVNAVHNVSSLLLVICNRTGANILTWSVYLNFEGWQQVVTHNVQNCELGHSVCQLLYTCKIKRNIFRCYVKQVLTAATALYSGMVQNYLPLVETLVVLCSFNLWKLLYLWSEEHYDDSLQSPWAIIFAPCFSWAVDICIQIQFTCVSSL